MLLNSKTVFIINKRKSVISVSPTRAAFIRRGFRRSGHADSWLIAAGFTG